MNDKEWVIEINYDYGQPNFSNDGYKMVGDGFLRLVGIEEIPTTYEDCMKILSSPITRLSLNLFRIKHVPTGKAIPVVLL